jgi:hypothetical protein
MTRAKVFDLFGGEYKDEPKVTVETPEEKTGKAKSDKIDRAERLIDHYCIHLNTIINYRTYSDYMDPSEIVKISQIQLCMKTSQHPEAGALGGLYNTVIDIVRRTSSAQDFAAWQKSIDDEIARVRNANNIECSDLSDRELGQTGVVRENLSRPFSARLSPFAFYWSSANLHSERIYGNRTAL